MRSTGRVAGVIAVAASAALLLIGCTSGPTSTPGGTASGGTASGGHRSASASASASASPSAGATPQLVYSDTAAQNKPYFDAVNTRLIAKGGSPGGRAFIDNLVAAGFAKKDMQVTPDTTSIGLKADNIQFSVLFNGECLIGQYGNIGYASTVQPPLSAGGCLAGLTRPINW